MLAAILIGLVDTFGKVLSFEIGGVHLLPSSPGMMIYVLSTLPNVSTRPIRIAASIAPFTEPIPPITTTDETDDQDLIAHAGEHRCHRRRDHAGKRGQRHAQREHQPVQQIDIDAQRLHHLAVGAACADHHPQPRPLDQQGTWQRRARGKPPTSQTVDRVAERLGERDRSAQQRRHGHPVHVVRRRPRSSVPRTSGQAVGEQHLVQMVAM